MSPVDLGQTYRYRFPVKDSAGVLAAAGSVVVTVTLPDGTTATPTVVNSSVGLYDIAYTTTLVGLHSIKAVATGGVLGTETDVWEDVFVVEQAAQSFIGVDEALAHLRAQNIIVSDNDREQIRWLCIGSSDAVERDLNLAITRKTVVQTFDGGRYDLRFRTVPPRPTDGGIIAVDEVLVDGTEVTDYVVRKHPRWALLRGSSPYPVLWTRGYENVSVTYAAYCSSPPEIARRVALNTLQTAWQASQQSEHPFLDEVARRASLATLSTSVLPSLSQLETRAYNALKYVNMA